MADGEPLPDEITLSRDEAATVLFALDAAMESVDAATDVYRRLEEAARIIIDKFLPDLPEL